MIKFISILLLAFALRADAATPFYLSTRNPDGTAQTNQVLIQPWPPNQPFYIYGTNMVFGSYVVTNTPNSSGWFSNSLFAGVYTVIYANAPTLGFFVNIQDTTNYQSLTIYATNTPVASVSYGTMFGVVTNWLGYMPATNTLSGMLSALGFQPATNSYGCITNLLGGAPVIATYANVIAALGFTPVTNSYAAITNIFRFVPATNGGILAYSQLPYMPPTNSYSGLTNVLNFVPATNNPISVTNIWISGVTGITNASGYVTNLTLTLSTNVLNYIHK